jgi:hypothetical protein
VPSLNTIVGNLDRAQKGFLYTADSVPADRWRTPPGGGRWSAGELVGHLITVERAILRNIDKVLHKPPRALPFYKRFHIPMAVVELRLIRRKSPIPIDAQTLREKEAMLAELREVRERTLAFIEETMERDLSKYTMAHAFLGTLNVYECVWMVTDDCVTRSAAHKANAGNCNSSPKSRSKFAKVEHFYHSDLSFRPAVPPAGPMKKMKKTQVLLGFLSKVLGRWFFAGRTERLLL